MDAKSNKTLSILHNVYKNYSDDNDNIQKKNVIKLFYENKLMDICDFNIFLVNHYLNKLSPDWEVVTFEKFLQLIFFIYAQQTKMQLQHEEDLDSPDDAQNNIEFPDEIGDMSQASINLIMENTNMVRSYKSIVKVLIEAHESEEDVMKLCLPNFKTDKTELIWGLCDSKVVSLIHLFSKALYDIFLQNSKSNEASGLQVMNISNLITIIWNYHIYSNFDCEMIANIMSRFFYPFNVKITKEFIAIFDDPKHRNNPEQVREEFNKIFIDSDCLNFTFSTFAMILSAFAIFLPENSGKAPVDAINFFFKIIIEIREDNFVDELENIEEASSHMIDEDMFLDSKILEIAKRMQITPNADDEDFIMESLSILDKDLPSVDIILTMKNHLPNHSNKLFSNNLNEDKLKFPINIIKAEVDGKAAAITAEKERIMIEKAKKMKKRNARDPPVKPVFFDDLPSAEWEKLKYFGTKTIEDLKSRLLKNSYKEVLLNTNVYPSLIKEVLIIPRGIPNQVIETVLNAVTEASKGRYEVAINLFERAEYEFNLFKKPSHQVELYFLLNLGNIYESLELHLMGFNYFMQAKGVTDRLEPTNPDVALSYASLGSIMIKLREYEWALRCFWKAKDIREYTIGGNSLDCATIYNNLGVTCYYLEIYYAAYGFLNLAYEIYKETLGTFHQRTIQIKSNLTKLNYLKFNKTFEYKQMGVYNTLKLDIPNPKKAKKK